MAAEIYVNDRRADCYRERWAQARSCCLGCWRLRERQGLPAELSSSSCFHAGGVECQIYANAIPDHNLIAALIDGINFQIPAPILYRPQGTSLAWLGLACFWLLTFCDYLCSDSGDRFHVWR